MTIRSDKAVRPGNARARAERRRRLLLSVGVAAASIGTQGGQALADCTPTSLGSNAFICTGTNTQGQTVNADGASVTTAPGYSVQTDGMFQTALHVFGAGDISFVDENASTISSAQGTGLLLGDPSFSTPATSLTAVTNGVIRGATAGIATVNITGPVSITSTGTVEGTDQFSAGIYADTTGPSADITINVNEVAAGQTGIYAFNSGAGDTFIAATDTISTTGPFGTGVRAELNGGDATIVVNDIDSTFGINVRNSGGGTTSIATTGTIVADGGDFFDEGIEVRDGGRDGFPGDPWNPFIPSNEIGAVTIDVGGDITATRGPGVRVNASGGVSGPGIAVTTAGGTTVSGGFAGIDVEAAYGDVTVIANGDVRAEGVTGFDDEGDEGRFGQGIDAEVYGDGDVSVTANNVYSAEDGIEAFVDGAGVSSVTVRGDVVGETGTGVASISAGARDVPGSELEAFDGGVATVTLEEGATVTGGEEAIGLFGSDMTVTLAENTTTTSTAESDGTGIRLFGRDNPPTEAAEIGVGDATITVASGARVETDRGFAILDEGHRTTVVNAGTLDGAVLLGSQADRFEFVAGGSITGMVDGGNQDDAIDTFALAGMSAGAGIDATLDVTEADFDNDGATAVNSVALTGFERFEKIGTSTFEITGDNAEAFDLHMLEGGIVLSGGLTGADVIAASGTTLSGKGSVASITSAGVVSPGMVTADNKSGIGTLRVVGDATLRGDLAVDIEAGGRSDLLDVGGAVTIDGARAVVSTASASEAFGDQERFTIVQAGSGVSGTFSSIIENIPDVSLSALYDPNAVTLIASLDTVQTAKAAAPGAGAGAALSSRTFGTKLMGQAAGGTPGGSIGGVDDNGSSEFALRSDGLDGTLALAYTNSLMTDGSVYAADVIPLGAAPARRSSLAVFGGVLGADEHTGDDGVLVGYDAQTAGVFGGVRGTTALGAGAVIYGVGLAYSDTEVLLDGANADVQGLQGGAFAGYMNGALLATVAGSYGRFETRTTRVLSPGRLATGVTDGDAYTASGELSYDVTGLLNATVTQRSRIAPFVGLEGVFTNQDGFTETGSTLTVAASDSAVGYARAGIRASTVFTGGGLLLTPSASVGYEYGFGDLDSTVTNDLGFGLSPIASGVNGLDEHRLLLGAGLGVASGRLEATFGYEGTIADDGRSHRGIAELSIGF